MAEIGTSWTELVSYDSTYSGYTIRYRLRAKYSATSIQDNQHTVQLKWTTQKISGGTGIYENTPCTPKVTNITGGSPNSWTGTAFTIPTGSTAETDKAVSGDIVITHNNDGTYSATWNWSLSHVYEGGSKSGSVSVSLPTIPRASSFTLSSNSIYTNGTTTATITEADSSFAHKISGVYNNTTYYFLGSASSTSTALSSNLSVPTALRTAMATANAKSISMTLTLTTYSGSTVIGTATTSLTITVPTATVTVSPASVACDSATTTWTLANVDTTACTYTVQRLYGTTVRYTDQTKATTTTKSSLANANFQSNITTATSGTVTVKVTTYVGTTTVGTNTATYTVTIPTATYHPTVAYKANSEARTGNAYGSIAYLAGYNGVTMQFTTGVAGSSSATINSRQVSVANNVVNASLTYSGNTITVTTGTFPANSSNYSVTITVTVIDTRGASASVSRNVTVSGYAKPSVTTAKATRANSSGTADTEGVYANLTATGTAHSNASISSMQIKYGSASVKTASASTVTQNAYRYNNTDFNVNQSYTFTAIATDNLGFSTSISFVLASASYILSLHPSGGVGLGRVAQANRIESAYNVFATYATSATAGPHVSIVTPSGTLSGGATTNGYQIGMHIGSGGTNRGLYDFGVGDGTGSWLIYKDVNNNTNITSQSGGSIQLLASTLVKSELIINSASQTPGIYYRPTNTSANSNVMYPGRIYYQTSISGSEGRFAFRQYSPTSADPTIYTTGYEYYYLPAPAKDMTAGSTASYNILTTKNVVSVAQGGTGQTSLTNVTVGNATNATNATNSTLAYRLEGALAGKSGTTTTNRWYKIGTCTITGNNTDMTTVIVVSCPYGSLAHGGAQWGIARLKLRSGASGVGMTSGQIEWLGSNNLAPANFKLLIDTESTNDTRVNELWVYAAGSYQTWTVTKLTESGRSAIQANGTQGWKFTNNYAAEGSSAVTSGLTEVTPTFVQNNTRNLYNNATGTTGAITLSETAVNFSCLKIYYYSVHGTTNIYDSTEVYSPEGKQISLATNIYWSNAMVTTMRQILISGTALSNPSNEQAQFSVTNGTSPTRASTSSLIYIYRVDGIR